MRICLGPWARENTNLLSSVPDYLDCRTLGFLLTTLDYLPWTSDPYYIDMAQETFVGRDGELPLIQVTYTKKDFYINYQNDQVWTSNFWPKCNCTLHSKYRYLCSPEIETPAREFWKQRKQNMKELATDLLLFKETFSRGSHSQN